MIFTKKQGTGQIFLSIPGKTIDSAAIPLV